MTAPRREATRRIVGGRNGIGTVGPRKVPTKSDGGRDYEDGSHSEDAGQTGRWRRARSGEVGDACGRKQDGKVTSSKYGMAVGSSRLQR